jgi:hypothetical protein
MDLTGGMELSSDEMTADAPTAPTYREGVSIWLWDDAARFGFPRIGVEAVGATWDTAFGVALCMAKPGGDLLLVTEDGPPHPVSDGDGRPRVLGAGPLSFRCVEPFAQWRVEFDGDTVATDVDAYLARGQSHAPSDADTARCPLTLEIVASMVGPPWVYGTREPEGSRVAGEHRFEQLCAVTGTVRVDGRSTPFTGGGLRVHRKGGNRSDYGDFYGHVWQSAWFPSGRAFGLIHYRPRPDGSVKYREGWVLDGGKVVPARVEGTPWMTATRPSGEDVSFTLRTAKGSVRIAGETFMSSFRPPRQVGDGTAFPLLQSGIARYQWDDETAFGMIERSALL